MTTSLAKSMRTAMALLAVIGVCLCYPGVAQEQTLFSRQQVLDDMAYLRQSLEDTNYDLYAYVSKAAFDQQFTALEQGIVEDSYSRLAANTLFQRAAAIANIGHTNVGFPIADYREYAMAGGTVFPVEIAFEGDVALVTRTFGAPDGLQAGDSVLSINGEPIAMVLAQMMDSISAETDYFKLAKIESTSFPREYWKLKGRVDEFLVVVSRGGDRHEVRVAAVDVIEGFESRRDEILNFERKLDFRGHVAYLNPGSFSGDEVEYREFVDGAFREIRERGSDTLILDFRNNAGGDDAFSDYLVSYVAQQPFQWQSSFTMKTSRALKEDTRKHRDLGSDFFKAILAHEDGAIYAYQFADYQPQPPAMRFRGKVYVLINRHSNSQSTVAAAQLSDYGWATLVGEVTAEFPSLYASQFSYPLPNTGIMVNSSKSYIIRVNGDASAGGLQPDIAIKEQPALAGDEVLEGLLARLE